MRNKGYVIAVSIPAILLAWAALHMYMNENALFALVLGALAAGLGYVATRVAKAEPFAPPKKPVHQATNDNVKRWLKVQTDEAHEAETPSAAQSQVRRQ